MFMHSRSHEPQNTKETSRAREHPKVKVPARSSSWARCACDATLRDSQLFSHSDSHIKYTQKGGTRSTLIHSQPFERCSPLHALCVARQSCMLGCRAGPRPHPNSTRPRAGTCRTCTKSRRAARPRPATCSSKQRECPRRGEGRRRRALRPRQPRPTGWTRTKSGPRGGRCSA